MGIIDSVFGRKQLETPTKKEEKLSLKDSLNKVKKVEVPTTRKVSLKVKIRNHCGCGGTDWNTFDFNEEVPYDSPLEDGMTVSESQIKVVNGEFKLK